ncbi:MAG: hypothetical protein IKC42_01475 [Alistipes sp.]|nr:hypothetical protein [Alistipes sp.]
MVWQIVFGVLGILIGGGGLIAFVVGLIRPPRISPEELAAFEERKRKEKKRVGGPKRRFNIFVNAPWFGGGEF